MAGFSFALAPNRKAAGAPGAVPHTAFDAGGSKRKDNGGTKAATPVLLPGFDGEEEEGIDVEPGPSRLAGRRSSQAKNRPLSVFGEDEDEDEDGSAGQDAEDDGFAKLTGPSSSSAPGSGKSANASTARAGTGSSAKARSGSSTASEPVSRASRLAADQALAQDASIFEYDSVYDAMKTAAASAKQKKAEAEQEAGILDEDGRPAPKYIDAFLKASVQRRRDRERAEAKKIQRERDAEGDEFADKEAFVTDAYREQMETIRKEEEEEARRQGQHKSKGVQAFYSNLLSDQSAAHEAAVKAANAAVSASGTSSGSASRDVDTMEGTADTETASLARKIEAARASGLDVEINDDNQVVDNRSLLNKGLNFISKNRAKKAGNAEPPSRLLPVGRSSSSSGAAPPTSARGLSTAQSFNSSASRARQSLHLEAQLLEVQKKRAAEEELEREKARAKLMSVAAGSGAKSREEREEERRKARERALARRGKSGSATTQS